MFFRNLTIFTIDPAHLARNFDPVERNEGAAFEIEAPFSDFALAECALKPVGPLELSSQGFVSPLGADHADTLTHRHKFPTAGAHTWLTVGSESKILPAAAVNAELAKRIADLERNEGRKPGGRARKRLKEDLLREMLPKAFVRPGRTDAWLDHARGLVVVDTATHKRAEAVVSEIRHALGSFPALPLHSDSSVRATLTGWLAGGARRPELPDGFALGDSAVLQDPSDRARVRLTDQELLGPEVVAHLEAGKQCTRLALVYGDLVAFTIDEALTFCGVRFLDGAVDALDSQEAEDLQAELDARFALMTGTLGQLFDALFPALNVSKGEGSHAS